MNKPKGHRVSVSISIPEDLHRRVLVHCGTLPLSTVIRSFLRQWLSGQIAYVPEGVLDEMAERT